MRQGQQNRRGRGRGGNNNNRKNQNPLTRSFESNGPDVKIRGTPAHVAEKYMALARDALSSSDPVLAENYLQHAEHYNRIIMTYREQQVQQNSDAQNNGAGRQQQAPDQDSEQNVSEPADFSDNQPPEAAPGAEAAPTPRNADAPASGRSNSRPRRGRAAGGDGKGSGAPRGRRREPAPPREAAAEKFGAESEQPEFLRRPVRRTKRAADVGEGDQPTIPTPDDASAE